MPSEHQLQTSLTFQFVLAQSTYPRLARPENSTPNLLLVQRTLRLPLKAVCTSCGKAHEFFLRLSDLDEAPNNSKWRVVVDRNVAPAIDEVDALRCDQKYFHFHGIKITTRLFGAGDVETEEDEKNPSHIHTINMKSEIAGVLKQLQSRLSKLYRGSQMWLFPSSRCGIDVHLHSTPSHLPLGTIKNTAFQMVAYQRLFDSIHATHRITSRSLFEAKLGAELDGWLEQINSTPDKHSLNELLRGVKVAKILDVSKNETITFGQLASTFDSMAVMAWTDVVTKVVSMAHSTGSETKCRAPTYTAQDMLRDLHVKKSTITFYKSKTKDQFTQLDEDLASALVATGRKDLLGPLAMHVANTALANNSFAAVEDKIMKKLREGGYGRLGKDYIDTVEAASKPPAEAKEEEDSWTLL